MDYKIDKQIGSGEGCVYVYYYSNDKDLAKSKNLDVWECKIGFSTRPLFDRLSEQIIPTSISKLPIVGLQILVDYPQILETWLHKELSNKKLIIAPEMNGI